MWPVGRSEIWCRHLDNLLAVEMVQDKNWVILVFNKKIKLQWWQVCLILFHFKFTTFLLNYHDLQSQPKKLAWWMPRSVCSAFQCFFKFFNIVAEAVSLLDRILKQLEEIFFSVLEIILVCLIISRFWEGILFCSEFGVTEVCKQCSINKCASSSRGICGVGIVSQ